MRQIVLSAVMIVLMIPMSCKKGPGIVRSYGDVITVRRESGAFTGIITGEKFRIFLKQDLSTPEFVEITYGQNVIDKISTEIKDGYLVIEDRNHFNWVRDLEVHPVCTVNVHDLTKLVARGASEVSCIDTLKVSDFDFKMEGVGSHHIKVKSGQVHGSCTSAGHVVFEGWGGLLAWSCENGGWIDASAMGSSDAYIFHYTDRDVYVNPETIFKAYVYGKGNVYYYRNPWMQFEKKEFGQGKVIKL